MCWLLWALLVIWTSLSQAEGCNYTYVSQPPSSLGCNPLGIQILLTCGTDPLPQSATLNWYWTQNISDAGVNGTPILPGDNSDGYVVTVNAQPINGRQLTFTVTDSTLGYYWCEIGNVTDVSLRPTTITPVCSTGSSQIMNCTDTEIADKHVHMAVCAVINSPFSQSPLPTPCAAPLQISKNSKILSSSKTSISSAASETMVLSLSSISTTSDPNGTLTGIIIDSTTLTTTSYSTSSSYHSITPSPSSSTIPDTNILPWVIIFGCIISVAFIVFLVASFVLLVYVTKKRRHKEPDSLAVRRPAAVSRENLLETAGSVTQLNESFSNDESTQAGNNTVVHMGLRANQALDNPLYSEVQLGTRPLLTQKVECNTQQPREEEFVNSERTVNKNGVQCPKQLSLDNPIYYKPDFTIKEHIDGDYYSVVKNNDGQLENHLSLENHYQEVESPYMSPVSLNEQRPLLNRACSPYLAPIPLHQMNNTAQLPATNDENCYDQVHVVNASSGTIPPILVSPYEVPVEKKEDVLYDVLNEK